MTIYGAEWGERARCSEPDSPPSVSRGREIISVTLLWCWAGHMASLISHLPSGPAETQQVMVFIPMSPHWVCLSDVVKPIICKNTPVRKMLEWMLYYGSVFHMICSSHLCIQSSVDAFHLHSATIILGIITIMMIYFVCVALYVWAKVIE